MKSISKKLAVLLMSASFVAGGFALPAFAQTDTNTKTGDAAVDQAASGPKTTKSQRKAARKQARAKKNAELKKLEANGYSPSKNDPNYPTDLQNAQKKAGIGQAASQ